MVREGHEAPLRALARFADHYLKDVVGGARVEQRLFELSVVLQVIARNAGDAPLKLLEVGGS